MDLKLPDREVPLHLFGPSGSSLDLAWKLYDEGRLPEWGSLLVESQSAGRGRMGRVWQSPPGHVYAALRLPLAGPFAGGAASLTVAFLLVRALADFGQALRIKWPNDLIGPGGKVGGILLENKRGGLMAGVGLNLGAPPGGDWARDPKAPPASALSLDPALGLTPEKLWAALVEKMNLIYNKKFGSNSSKITAPCDNFPDETGGLPVKTAGGPPPVGGEAEKLLLWRGLDVLVDQPGSTPPVPAGRTLAGRVLGLTPEGALRLQTPDGEVALWSGQVYLTK